MDYLEVECGLCAGSNVADIGSGTGLFAHLFLRRGCEVFGVEPNAEMRAAGERLLAGEERFHSIDGRAEATGLPDQSVDFVAAGQAFHWFDQTVARAEFRRILRTGGWVVLGWNERLVEGRFLEGYEELLLRYAPEYSQVDHRRMDAGVMDDFFGPVRWKAASFANEQRFDLDGVLGRLHSSSYAPVPGTEAGDRMDGELTRLFEQTEAAGEVTFRYETKLYCGRVGD